MDENDIFQVARFKLAHIMPYISDALFSLIPTIKPGFETMAVDKFWRCYYDPEVIRTQWTLEEVVAVLYHEVNHLLREHPIRGATKARHEAFAWNIAADLEINDDIKAMQELNLPENTILPAQFNLPDGEVAEWYFNHLPMQEIQLPSSGADSDKPMAGGSCGSAAGGPQQDYEDGEPGEDGTEGLGTGLTPQEAEVIKDKVAENIEKSHNQGNIPAGLRRWAEKHGKPVVDWRKQLAAAVRRSIAAKSGKADYTYKKPSRRETGNIIMPSTYEPVPSIAEVIDTSGSVGSDSLNQFIAETNKVLRSCGIRDGVMVYCVDAAVASAKRITNASQIQIAGGGGTDMRIGIDAAMKSRPRPEIVIVFTDGYTPWPEVRPAGLHLIVALDNEHMVGSTPSWAKTIVIQPQGE